MIITTMSIMTPHVKPIQDTEELLAHLRVIGYLTAEGKLAPGAWLQLRKDTVWIGQDGRYHHITELEDAGAFFQALKEKTDV